MGKPNPERDQLILSLVDGGKSYREAAKAAGYSSQSHVFKVVERHRGKRGVADTAAAHSPRHKCTRCKHEWTGKKAGRPYACPKCQCLKWDEPLGTAPEVEKVEAFRPDPKVRTTMVASRPTFGTYSTSGRNVYEGKGCSECRNLVGCSCREPQTEVRRKVDAEPVRTDAFRRSGGSGGKVLKLPMGRGNRRAKNQGKAA